MTRKQKSKQSKPKHKGSISNVNQASSKTQEIINSPGVGHASLAYKSVHSKVYRFTERSSSDLQFYQQAGTTTTGGINFTLSSITDVSSYTTIFDQYKIEMIEVRCTPRYTEATLGTPSATAIMPRLYTVIDYNDSTVPGSINQLKDYGSCVVTTPGASLVRTIIPQLSTAVYSGSFTSYMSANGWVDTSSPNVQYYGLKYAIEPGSGSSSLQTYLVDVVYYVAFRNTV
jgi:hypothetical protein